MKIHKLPQVNEDEEDYSKYSFEHGEKNNVGFISNRIDKEGDALGNILTGAGHEI
jgi:hypothetical protein